MNGCTLDDAFRHFRLQRINFDSWGEKKKFSFFPHFLFFCEKQELAKRENSDFPQSILGGIHLSYEFSTTSQTCSSIFGPLQKKIKTMRGKLVNENY